MAFISTKKMQLTSAEQSGKSKALMTTLMTRNCFCLRPLCLHTLSAKMSQEGQILFAI